MKLTRLLAIFIGIYLTVPDLGARERRGGGGGGSHFSPPKRSSGRRWRQPSQSDEWIKDPAFETEGSLPACEPAEKGNLTTRDEAGNPP